MDYSNRGGYDSSRGRVSANRNGNEGYRSQRQDYSNRPRRSYQSDDYRSGGYQSGNRFPSQSTDASGEQRQQRPRRPRFSEYTREGGNEQGQRPSYRSQNGGSSRPRFRRPAESVENGYRPRAERVDSHAEGEYRPRPRFNKENYSQRKQQEYRRREPDMNKPMRLNKYLANAGICSRREADDFIQAGVITVNGEVVSTLGAKVNPGDKVMFHDQTIRREQKVYILLNKPKNCVTTTDDPQERKTVIDIVKNACSERIYPVGRLDRNTTGVLLLTNDGDLAAKLTHPKFGKKKIYAATLDRDLDQADFDTIMQGVILDDELIVPDALEFTKPDDRRHLGLEIHSGQNRVVRRIFEKVGYKVMQLDRVSFAGLTKKNVARGKYRFLTPKEISMLQMGAFE